ncbi:hypothetical protein BB559_004808 [Furculomyces boomerangus]|uniref:Uncharacterized protein n=2 Tax=Harpellales TaxID=61421 RepID=A0A2T9YCK3_9FUNG|nr:hypothetical protein BB559_004808 [Furculomyces boomerangus]PVZ99275.1 hypothetical protein BB558_004696 [Smittium angustum]
MSSIAHFEVVFPMHGTKVPTFKPGATVSGTVVLKLDSPIAASYIELKFFGIEEIYPVLEQIEPSADKKKDKTIRKESLITTINSSKEIMKKTFFTKDVLLWGEYINKKPGITSKKNFNIASKNKPTPVDSPIRDSQLGTKVQIIDSGIAHTYHFNVTMPKVNMPISKKTDRFEIKYILKASIFSESKVGPGKKSIVKEIYSTSERIFNFEPIMIEKVEINRRSLPFRTSVYLKESQQQTSAIKKFIKSGQTASENPSSDKNTEAIIFQPYPSYTPSEQVDVLILIPGNKSIKSATYEVNEIIRCKKSSAPTIDDSEVPLLWIYTKTLDGPSQLHFNKLSKANISTDLGLMGRFMFTNLNSNESSGLSGTKIKNSFSNASMKSSFTPDTPEKKLSKSDNKPQKSFHNKKHFQEFEGNKSNTGGTSSVISLSIGTPSSRMNMMQKFQQDKVRVVPVPLGNLISNESYKYARIKFNLPSATELCSVPSVFLDFEYSIKLTLNIGGNFGQMKKLSGRIPIRIITKRNETSGSKDSFVGTSVASKAFGHTMMPHEYNRNMPMSPSSSTFVPGEGITSSDFSNYTGNKALESSNHTKMGRSSIISYHSDINMMNLNQPQPNGMGNSRETKNYGHMGTLSPTSSRKGSVTGNGHNYLDQEEMSFPNLQYYIQYGEKIPTPDIELVRIK